MEYLMKRFENHIAKFTDYGNIKILDFKNPESNEYRIRFLFEEDYYRLHISGDLGELTATNYCNMTFEKFGDFVHNSGYFEEKVDCCSRDLYIYDETKAKEELLKLIDDNDCREEMSESDIEWGTPEEIFEDRIHEIMDDFDYNTGFGNKAAEILAEYIGDIDCLSNLGRKRTDILDIYLLAFSLAKARLEGEENEEKTA